MFQILLRSLLLFLLGTAAPTYALANPPVLEVFVRDGCPHCSAAKDFLVELAERHPQLEIRLREVDRDPSARADLLRLSREAGSWPPAVPTFVIGERLLVGFDDAEHSGAQLIALLEQSVPQPATLESRLFGNLSLERLGLPLFTLALGLLDGFNPCAMWVLLFLLSLLVRLRDRHRMALIAGTFVLVSGAVYYLFMAAWLNLFLLVGLSSWLLAGLHCWRCLSVSSICVTACGLPAASRCRYRPPPNPGSMHGCVGFCRANRYGPLSAASRRWLWWSISSSCCAPPGCQRSTPPYWRSSNWARWSIMPISGSTSLATSPTTR
ncbi:MAG: glutaredoxin family protein [Gammaproteobacteria bacterium]